MRKIKAIVVHCAYTPPSMDIGAETIRQWHVKDNGWRDIGYHWVIRRNGNLEPGRDESVAGAHVGGHNANTIGVCLIGGMKEGGGEDCNFTYKQYNTLHSLLHELKARYPGAEITGHRDYASKACPCFDAAEFMR